MSIVNGVVHDKSKVLIKWNKPTSDYIDYIKVKMGAVGSNWETANTILDNYDINNEYIYQLTSSGTYTFFIKTVSTSGIESKIAISETLSIKIEPNDITGLNVTRKSNDATVAVLKWDANTELDFDHYVIKVGTAYATATVLEASWQGSTTYEYKLPSAGTFRFWAVAVNFSKNVSNPIYKDYTIASIKPSDVSNFSVSVSPDDCTKLSLKWDSISDTSDLKHYIVKVGDASSTWTTATGITTTTGKDYLYTLTSSKTIKFYVKAVNNGGEESVTEATTALTYYNIIPAQVTGFDAVQLLSVDRRNIKVSWTVNTETDIDHYVLKYGDNASTWSTATTLVSSKTTEHNFNLTNTGTYKFYIVAYNVSGNSSAVVTISRTFTMEPNTPATITAIQSSTHKANGNITWSAISDADLSHYVLEVSKDGGAYSTVLATTKSTAYTYTFSAEGAYIFRVKAVNLGGKSSSYVTATSLNVNLKPSAPTVPSNPVTLDPYDSSTIIVKWNGISDLEFLCYELVYGTVWSESAKQTTTSTTWTQKLDGGSGTYTFLVRSRNTLGYVSSVVTISGTVTIEPPNVTWNTPVQSTLDRTKITLSWIPISTDVKDFSHYVVKVGGTSWSNAATIATTKDTSIIYTLTAADHNVAKKFWIKAVKNAGYESVTANSITNTFLVKPTTPVSDKIYVEGKKIIVEWKDTNDLDLANYEVVEGIVWVDDSIVVRTTSRLEFAIENEGDYTFLIRAKSVAGIVSDILTMTITNVKVKPEDVEGFDFTQNPLKRNELFFSWQPADTFVTPDKYIIVKGTTWNLANKIAEVKETSFTYTTTIEGSQTYLIKAVATNGEWSVNPSTATKTVTLTPVTLTAPANTITQSNTDYSQITVIWNEVNRTVETDFDHYEVVVGTAWKDSTKQIVSDNKFTHTITTSGLHTFLIKAVSKAGYSSSALSVSKDLSLIPQNVGTITVSQRTDDKRYFTLKWSPVTNGDFRSYKVKKGSETSTWDTATLEQYDLNANTYETYIATETKEKVFVKAVNKLNKESAVASSVLIDTTATGTYNFRISAPTNATATWGGVTNRNKVTVAWDKHSDASLSHYEVKKLGVAWTDASVVKTSELSCTFTIPSNSTGAQSYVVRAVGKGGYNSSDVTVVSGTVSMNPSSIDNTTITFTQSSTDKRDYTVSWTAPSTTTDPDFDHYEIAWENATAGIAKTVLSNNLRNNYYVLTASNASQYTFYIKTYNTLGNVSAEVSKTFTPSLTPSGITGLTRTYDISTQGRNVIKVSWNSHADSDFDRFEVKKSTDAWSSAISTTELFYNFTVSITGSYTFDVRARNKAGAYSAVSYTTAQSVTLEPTAITGVTLSQSTDDKRNFTLTWASNSDTDFDYYIVKYENLTTSSGIMNLSTTPVTLTTFSVTLAVQNQFKFYVYAVNKIGVQSTAGTYTTPSTINLTPTALTTFNATWDVTKYGRNKVVLKWDASGEKDATTYQVKLSTDAWTNCVETNELTTTFTVSATGTHTFDIRVKNLAGFYSSSTSTTANVTMEPSNVVSNSITFTQSTNDKRNFSVKWGAVSDSDFDHYEIYRDNYEIVNLLTANQSDFEGTATNLWTNFGTCTYDTAEKWEGTRSVKFTANGTSANAGVYITDIVISAGQSYTSSAYVKSNTITKAITAIIHWINSSNVYVGTSVGTATNLSSVWNRITVTGTAPATAVKAYVTFYASLVSGDIFFIDGVMFENGNTLSTWSTGQSLAPVKRPLALNVKNPYYEDVLALQSSHNYYISAVNTYGKRSSMEASKSVTPNLTPATPTGFTATINPNKTNEVTLSWDKIVDLDLDYYEVKLWTETWQYAEKAVGTNITYTFPVASTTSGTISFQLRAKNYAGFVSSEATTSANMKFEPADVTGFTATINSNDKRNILLSWNNNTEGDISHYRIKQGTSWDLGTEITPKNILTNFYNDFLVYTNQTVTLWIKAYNKQGKESSAASGVTATVTLTPTKPATGKYVASSSNRFEITVSWDAVTDSDLVGYELVYKNTAGTETVVYTGKETSYTYTTTSVNGTHTFNVRSKNLSGFYSSVLAIPVTINAYPTDVGGFTVEQNPLDRRILKLKWNTNTDSDFSHYQVRKGTTWDGGSVVADKLKVSSVDLTVLVEETASYHVKAINAGGVGSSLAASQPITIRLIPLKPSTGSITQDINDKSILIFKWDKSADLDVSHYEVVSGGTTYQVKETFMNYYPTNLNTVDYSFDVKAVNVGDRKSTALSVGATVSFIPSDVTGLSVSQSILDHTKISLTWTAVSDRDLVSYKITRTRSGSQEVKTYSNITQTSYEDIIDNEDTFTWSIIAINKCGKQSINPTTFSSAFNMNPTAPSNITLTQSSIDRSICYINFTGINQQDLKEYDIRVGSSWDTATQIIKTKETTNIQWNPPQTGVYTILIKVRNNAGYDSDEASSPSTTITLEPSPVTNFIAIQNGTEILFTWDKSTDADVISYEIREGAQFDNGSVVESGITINSFSLPVDMEITRQFYIKAINIGGKYSSNAASVVITINDLPPKNVVNVYQELPEGYFEFDRTNYITASGISIASNVLTVEFWMNCSASASAHMIMGFGTSSATVSTLCFDPTTNTFGFNHFNGDTFGISNANTKLFNSWKFIVAEFVSNDTANCKLWIDGVKQTVSQVRGTLTNRALDSTITLGRGFATDTNTYAGKMKQVRIYNRALTDREVYDHFQGDYPESDSYLINYWKLNDIEGTVADDRKGVNDGTVGGTANWGLEVAGTASNVTFGKSSINCSNVGSITGKYFCSDYKDAEGLPTIRCNELGGELVMKLSKMPSLIPNQEDFSSATWTKESFAGTITSNATTAPDGTITADRINITGGSVYFRTRSGASALTPGKTYTLSAYYKAVSGSITGSFIGFWGYQPSSSFRVSSSSTTISSNTWTRISVTYTVPSGQTDFSLNVAGYWLKIPADFYVWGAQLDEGTVALPYKPYEATGSYTVSAKDMGQKITANIASQFVTTNLISAGSNATLQFRTSLDNVSWTVWRDFVPILATFRYIEFRVLLSSVDGAATPEVSLLTDVIDVPDKDKYGIINVPVGGLWVHFDPNSTDASPINFFYQQPSVVATASEQGKYAVVDESLISLYRFKVVVYNSSGTDIGGKVMWIAKGY